MTLFQERGSELWDQAFMTLFSGALTVSMGLYHWIVPLRIYQYWGVKVSLIAPPLLSSFIFLKELLGGEHSTGFTGGLKEI